MPSPAGESVRVREAVDTDAPRITELYRIVYGTGYVHPRFYDEQEVKRMVHGHDTLMLVAEEAGTGRIVGAASVLFTKGAYSDLVGEFGRLVVHPDFRGRRIGTRLMKERLARLDGRLHIGFAEVRVCNQHSPRISQRHGFVPVGALPQKLVFGDTREHGAYLVKHFGNALSLRRNHPRIVPEAHRLAERALSAVGLEPDAVVDEDAAPYPAGSTYAIAELEDEAYTSLLRIERGRIRHREIFGPQRLHYGLYKLAASHAHYIVAKDEGRIVGALGYSRDDIERTARVFEVIHAEEDAIHQLFEALEERCEAEGTEIVEVDVSAYAPRMQRTLLGMEYLPAAYVPALAFHEVERLDVVKMMRLRGPLQDLTFDAPEPTLSVGLDVLDTFAARQVLPRLARAMGRLDLCRGLSAEQTARLLGEFSTDAIEAGRVIFAQGGPPDRMVLVVSGRAGVSIDGERIGAVGAGETLGEVSFLSDTARSASAVAEIDMEVGVLTRDRMEALVRRRPDIGTVVYRNMARGLGEKLRRADRRVTARQTSAT